MSTTSTTSTTTTSDRGDRYGPMEWAQLMTSLNLFLLTVSNVLVDDVSKGMRSANLRLPPPTKSISSYVDVPANMG